MNFDELIKGSKPVLVDFSAEWCAPCKMMTPILSELKKMVGDRATILKVDVDHNPQAASDYHIMNVPTLVLFKNGEVKWKQAGVVPAAHLRQQIEQHC